MMTFSETKKQISTGGKKTALQQSYHPEPMPVARMRGGHRGQNERPREVLPKPKGTNPSASWVDPNLGLTLT